MSTAAPFGAVLHLSGFSISQEKLEALLNVPVGRYSPDEGGHAQLTIEDDDLGWAAIEAFLRSHGAAIKRLRDGENVQSACLDLGYNFYEGMAAISRTVPAQVAALAGSCGIDVMFSVYLTKP